MKDRKGCDKYLLIFGICLAVCYYGQIGSKQTISGAHIEKTLDYAQYKNSVYIEYLPADGW